MNGVYLNYPFLVRIISVLALCFITTGCFTVTPTNDVKFNLGSPSLQRILTSAEEIRKLTDSRKEIPVSAVQRDQTAKSQFESALSTWRGSPQYTPTMGNDAFNTAPVKLLDAYIGYLNETKKIAPAVDVLRIAVQEADKARSYRRAVRYRIELAETLERIGQLEAAQSSLTEAQAIVDRVFGQLSTGTNKIDPFQLAANAAVFSASVRLGVAVDPVKLASFADRYANALEATPVLRFVSIETPSISFYALSHQMNDEKYYRRDQETWRWLAIGALRAGDKNLAKKLLNLMLNSSEAAERNIFADEWKKGLSSFEATSYMQGFYISPENLRHQKFLDIIFGLETKFASALAAAEMYLMLDEPSLAEKMIAQAKATLPAITTFSDELKSLGHIGLRVEQRTADIQRVTGKLLIKNQRWRDALIQLDQYIEWSEAHRNLLSLEERLPYFRSKVQGAYLDALIAKASLYVAEPSDSNFFLALEALGRLKARHLRDSLDAVGKIKVAKEHSTKSSIDSIVKDNQGFLSITDTGEKLILFFADRDGKKIRITNKPKDFDKIILSFRNNLAELQMFDASTARQITVQTLGELETKVFGKQRLVVEIDGSLSFLPVELWLSSNMVPLGKETAVSYIPSLAMTDQSRTSSPVKGVLALGDARFDQKQQISAIGGTGEYATRGKRNSFGFSPLPETREEIVSIIKSVREGGKAILGQDATKSNFFQEARVPYRYLHVATHGVVGGEIPRLNEPALVLTPEGKDPGFLTATEIGKMDISADLVVLSACNSGNGEYYNGEGLMGLGRAFILAGAKAVVVSLWPVDSMTTKELMVKFYSELEVTGNATLALANARKAIMDSSTRINKKQRGLKIISSKTTASDFSGRTNPFYWAPFIVVESGL